MFETILAAADGPEQSARAVTTAADIAAKYDSRLLIIHVVQPGPVPPQIREKLKITQSADTGGPSHPLIANVPSWMDSAIEAVKQGTGEAHALLQSIAREILSEAGTAAVDRGIKEPETLVEHGDPAATILGAAKDRNVDLIVTGRRGLGQIRGLLLGSVSSKISQLFDRCYLMVG